MSDNKVFFDWAVTKVTHEIDAGEFARERTGQKLTIWVNAPGVIESLYGGRAMTVVETTDAHGKPTTETHYDPETPEKQTERMRKAVSILFEMPLTQIAKIDDSLLTQLYNRGFDEYAEYHAELRKNSTGG